MAGGQIITISHRPTPFRTCEGEARLGNGLPTFSPRGLPARHSIQQRPTERAVSIGGDPIATGSFPARRYGVADDPQDQTVVVLAQSLPHLLASAQKLPRVAVFPR